MKNEFTVTKELYMSWNRENMWKGIRLKFKILWTVTAILLIAFNIFLHSVGDGRLYLYVYGVSMALYCIYRGYFRESVLTAMQYRRNINVVLFVLTDTIYGVRMVGKETKRRESL